MRPRARTVPAIVLALAAGCSGSPSPPARACLPGLARCSGLCVDLEGDGEHCGACGHTCGAGETCRAGQCAVRCDAPLAACPAADRCIDLSADSEHCGGCGQPCASGEACALAVCRVGCGGAWARCGERCIDTRSDAEHCGACGVACGPGQVCAGGSCSPAGSAPGPSLFVSLTADDTFAHQFDTMARALEAHAMRATFYVNVGRLDLAGYGYLTRAQLLALHADGHEIGSHGLTHQHLTLASNPPDRIRRELCDSRAELLALGVAVRSFAYPFGDTDDFASRTAAECGYVTARDVGTLSPSRGVFSDTVPPADPFALRAASSVGPAHSLEHVQALVVDAEAAAAATGAPGWLIVNFHELCPNAACSTLAWDDGLFEQLVAWLAGREPLGTVVRTISEVAGGPLAPPVRSADRYGTPLVVNGDFESALGGDLAPADCWTRAHSGTHTDAWARVPGRSGMGERVVVSDWVSGASTLLQSRGPSAGPDYRSCGTPVIPGRTYTFRCWVRSDVRVALSLHRNDATRTTSPWRLGPSAPASPDAWAPVSFTATIPEGFNTVFFGPHVASVCATGCLSGASTATVLVDDCSATDEG